MKKCYESLKEEELVVLANAKDKEAFAELLRRYDKFISYRIRFYRIKGADANDIIQEGRIGLYKAVTDYIPGRSSFSSFAILCINGEIKRAVRAADSKKHLPLNNYISLYDIDEKSIMRIFGGQQEMVGENPTDYLIDNEAMKQLREYIEKELTDIEKKVLRCFAQGKSYSQIALEMKTDVKSVDNAIQRARKKLTAYLMKNKSRI